MAAEISLFAPFRVLGDQQAREIVIQDQPVGIKIVMKSPAVLMPEGSATALELLYLLFCGLVQQVRNGGLLRELFLPPGSC